jgi:hypothetical protein
LSETTVVRINKLKTLGLTLLMLVLVLLGCWLMLSSSATFATGLVAVLIFGPTFLALLFVLLVPSLLLVIDEEGIHNYYPFWRPLMIRWEEIACIRVVTARFASSLSVDLAPEGRQSYIARNFGAGKTPARLTQDQLSTAFSAILMLSNLSGKKARAFIQERYAEQIKRYRIVL